MSRTVFVTLHRLNRALGDVQRELEAIGLWNARLAAIDVYLLPAGAAHGWQHYGTSGEISIPAVSLARLADWWTGRHTSLRGVLRHEFAHALADTHPCLVRSRAFRVAFGHAHDAEIEGEFAPEEYVSEYAATAPAEDFAETFEQFVTHRGRCPLRFRHPIILRKWRYIDQLRRTIRRGKHQL